MRIINLTLALATLTFVSCKMSQESDIEALNSAERINANVVRGAQKTEVLIYYANESAPDGDELKNVQALEARFAKFPELKTLVDSLQADRKVFPDIVDKQLADLKANLCGKPDKALIAFTNRTMRGPTAAKGILFCRPGKAAESVDLSPGYNEFLKAHPKLQTNFLASGNPMSMTATFDWALKQVEAIFPPQTSSYVLISKSHGSGQFLVTPKLTMRSADVQDDDISKLRGAVLLKSFWYFADFVLNRPAFGSNADKPASRMERLAQLDKTGEDKTGEDKAGEDKTGEASIASGAYDTDIGIRKIAFMNSISKHSQMQFSIIFLDACKSYLPKDVIAALRADDTKSNIGSIYTSDDYGLPYDLLDFSKINFDPAKRLSTIIDDALKDKVGK